MLVGKVIVRKMKKFLFLLLLFTTIVGTSITNPTLTTLILKSSEILTDYEGSLQSYFKPLNVEPLNVEPLKYYSIEYNTTHPTLSLDTTITTLVLRSRIYELLQIGPNSFLVLGSPIEWDMSHSEIQ